MATKTKQPFARPWRIDNLFRAQLDELMAKVLAIPESLDLSGIIERVTGVQGGPSELFQRAGTQIAKRMVNEVAAENARDWREAAAKSHNGRAIYRMLQNELRGAVGVRRSELITENALLIGSLPAATAVQANHYIATEQLKGRRSGDIAADLRKRLPDMKRHQVERLARTEVSKADTAITRARSESIRITAYVWETS